MQLREGEKNPMKNTRVARAITLGGLLLAGSLLTSTWALAQTAGPPALGGQAAAAGAGIPRTADGHPSLDGLWGGASGALNTGEGVELFAGRGGTFYGFEEDNGLARMATLNKPVYKPEYWEQIKENDYDGDFGDGLDPRDSCFPEGLPRIGAPSAIIQVPDLNLIVFKYATGFDGRSESRIIPTDGRPHNAANVQAETWYGDSVGHWEGDTLVIDTIGFTDQSWLHKNGYIHGFNMDVVEKITRGANGNPNQFTWTATVTDPEYMQQPWTMDPIVKTLNVAPNGYLAEDLPCSVDGARADHVISHTRSG
jgi:hypothetical protein